MDTSHKNENGQETSSALAKWQEPLAFRVLPAADIFETNEAFIVQLDIPGAVKESIRVNVKPGNLSASAEIAPLHSHSSIVLFDEIGRKSYFREFSLGNGVSHEGAQASYENGVLTIAIPKSNDLKSRDIAIR